MQVVISNSSPMSKSLREEMSVVDSCSALCMILISKVVRCGTC